MVSSANYGIKEMMTGTHGNVRSLLGRTRAITFSSVVSVNTKVTIV